MIACSNDILQRIVKGDEHAFAELYNTYKARLLRLSYSITRSKHIAEETVEDVFIQVWCNRQKINEIKDITVYLYTAVKNRSLNTLSKKSYEVISTPFDFLQIELEPLGQTPYDALVTREMLQKMNAAIESLPARCKMIFKLIREDGLQYKEVAEILNISVKTIDSQMAIAIKRICTATQVVRKKQNFIKKLNLLF